jgi:hypothetical protein
MRGKSSALFVICYFLFTVHLVLSAWLFWKQERMRSRSVFPPLSNEWHMGGHFWVIIFHISVGLASVRVLKRPIYTARCISVFLSCFLFLLSFWLNKWRETFVGSYTAVTRRQGVKPESALLRYEIVKQRS